MNRKPLTNKAGEVRELTREDIRSMRPAKEVLSPELYEIIMNRKRGERGPQKEPTKIPLTVRYSREVVDYFKSTGAGWQSRMNEALQEWVAQHSRA